MQKLKFVFIVAILLLSFSFANASVWWDENYDVKQTLTLNTMNILDINIDKAHPILIDINSSDTNFWSVIDENGTDIRFVFDSNINKDNIVSYFKFDETAGAVAIDSNGTNDGRVVGATMAQPGQVGYSYYFDQFGDDVNIGNESNFDFLTKEDANFTLSAWVKVPQDTADVSIRSIFSKMHSSYCGVAFVFENDGVGGLSYRGYENAGTSNEYKTNYGGFDNNQWRHTVVTVASGVPIIYVDGLKVPTTLAGGSYHTCANDTNLRIGTYFEIPGLGDFNGYIDEVSIWNIPLSETQVVELYQQNKDKKTYQDLNSQYPLPYHFEDFNVDTNTMLAWVRVPRFSNDFNTTIDMYYDANNQIDFSDTNLTYPSTYNMAYHLKSESDATSSLLKLTGSGGVTPNSIGQIGYGYDFDGAAGKMVNAASIKNNPTELTYYLWVKPTANVASGDTYNLGGTVDGSQNSGWLTNYFNSGGTYYVGLRTWTAEDNLFDTLASPLSTTEFSQMVYSIGPAGKKIYVNTNKIAEDILKTSYTIATTALYIGADSRAGGGINDGFYGIIDETKILNYQLDSNEINLLYASEKRNLITFGEVDANIPIVPTGYIPARQDFNVYQTGSTTHMNNIAMDCNVNIYDLSGQNSPFFNDFNKDNVYSCIFSSPGHDANTIEVLTDTNYTHVVLLRYIDLPDFNYVDGNGLPWHNTGFTITFYDVNFKGTKRSAQYSIDGGAWTNFSELGNDYSMIILSGDLNHVVDFNFQNNFDYNYLGTVYGLYDGTPPTVAATALAGFTVYTNFFKGTGTILGGAAADVLSGINTTTCQYTQNNSVSWLAATWNTDHCESVGWTGINGMIYTFNTRVADNATNIGVGAAAMAGYTYDTNGPQTDINISYNVSDTNVGLTAKDANSGVKYVWYNLNNAGWTRVAGDFNWFLVSGGGTYNLDYLSTDNLDTNEITNNTTIGVNGIVRIKVIDENTKLYLDNVTVNFDDTNYVFNKTIDLNLYNIMPGQQTLTFYATDYGVRQYMLDMNKFFVYDINMMLLPVSLGAEYDFKAYDINETIINNGFLELYRLDSNGYSAGRMYTSSLGEATFFISIYDHNYMQRYDLNSGVQGIIQPIRVLIRHPKDEVTLAIIKRPHDGSTSLWDLIGIERLYQTYESINGDKNYYILSNLADPYTIEVRDDNNAYYPREYLLQYIGDKNYDELQPYLLSATDAYVVRIFTQNSFKVAIPGINIKIEKLINNQYTLIASNTTDSAGSALFPLLFTGKYRVKLFEGLTELTAEEPQNIQVSSANYYFTIAGFEYYDPDIVINLAHVTWRPLNDIITTDNNIIQIDVNGIGVNFLALRIYQYNDINQKTGYEDKNIIFSDCDEHCIYTFNINDINDVNLLKPFFIDANVYIDNNSKVSIFSKRYIKGTAITAGGGINLVQLFINAKKDFGCDPTWESFCILSGLLSIFIALLAAGGLMYLMQSINPTAMAACVGGILVIATIVGWLWWGVMALIAIVLIVGLGAKKVDD